MDFLGWEGSRAGLWLKVQFSGLTAGASEEGVAFGVAFHDARSLAALERTRGLGDDAIIIAFEILHTKYCIGKDQLR